jgi:hypothetical protein
MMGWEPMPRRSFKIELRGTPKERVAAVLLSLFILLGAIDCRQRGPDLCRNGITIGTVLYYQIVFSVLAFAAVAFVWGCFRPRWLEFLLRLVASRVAYLLLAFAVVGVLGAVFVFVVAMFQTLQQ